MLEGHEGRVEPFLRKLAGQLFIRPLLSNKELASSIIGSSPGAALLQLPKKSFLLSCPLTFARSLFFTAPIITAFVQAVPSTMASLSPGALY